MAFRTSPQLGPDVNQKGAPYFGFNFPLAPSYQANVIVPGSDAGVYRFVRAGGTIAASAQLAITTGGVATTGGTSGWYVPTELTGGVVSGDWFHARQTAAALA